MPYTRCFFSAGTSGTTPSGAGDPAEPDELGMPPLRRAPALPSMPPPLTRPDGSRTDTTGWSNAGALASSAAWPCRMKLS